MTRGEDELCLDVVPPAEVVALAEPQLPAVARLDPFLEHVGNVGERVVDLDLRRNVGALCGRRSRLYSERRHHTSGLSANGSIAAAFGSRSRDSSPALIARASRRASLVCSGSSTLFTVAGMGSPARRSTATVSRSLLS